MTEINWTRPMLQRFKAAYQKAFDEHLEGFCFDGHEFNTAYAKYLLEYLQDKFK